MSNTIDAHLEFSFQGETHSLTSCIDLDQFMTQGHSFSSFYALLAQDHHIDTYSYHYEVMQEEPIGFQNPQGAVANFFHDGILDLDGFSAAWKEQKILALLQPVALREMGISDLNQEPGLKNVLIHAYNLGRSA